MLKTKQSRHLLLSIIFLFVFTGFASAQTDTTGSGKKDTTSVKKDTTNVIKDTTSIVKDTTGVVKDTASVVKKSDTKKSKKKNTYILYGGANFNNLQVSSGTYESSSKTGWHLGAAYKSGKFLYWQAGARYSNSQFGLRAVSGSDTTKAFTVSSLDLPITGGINLLPFMSRFLNIHVFVSAVPSFVLNVSDNKLGITKDKTNSFIFYGQGGLGVDVAFLVLEAGYNYGFSGLLENDKSNPRQVFVNVGFRF